MSEGCPLPLFPSTAVWKLSPAELVSVFTSFGSGLRSSVFTGTVFTICGCGSVMPENC